MTVDDTAEPIDRCGRAHGGPQPFPLRSQSNLDQIPVQRAAAKKINPAPAGLRAGLSHAHQG
jgi:hypothetical protein